MNADRLRDELTELIERMGCRGKCCSLTAYIDLESLLARWGGPEEGPPSSVMVEAVKLAEFQDRPIILIR